MNPRYSSCALIAMALLLMSQQLASAQFESRYNFSGNYYVGFEYMMLDREELTDASRNLIYADNGGVPQSVALSTDSLQFDNESAQRVTFGAYLGARGQRLEASYFWMNQDWFATESLGMGDLSLGTQIYNNSGSGMQIASLTPLQSITAVTAERNSHVSGIEFNYVGAIVADNWHFNPIIGIRGFNLEEELRMSITTLADPILYTSQAENWLIGPQVGGELGYNVYRFGDSMLNFNVIGKFGLAANITSASYSITVIGGTSPDAPDDSEIALSPFAEFGVQAELTYGRLVARIGYQAMMLDNVDLGGVPPDLFVIGADTVTPNDTVFIHGFNAGGTISF